MKNYNVEYIYPTPLYVTNVYQLDDIQKELQSVIDKTEFVQIEHWKNTHYLSSKSFEDDIIKDNNLVYFSDELDFHIRNFCNEMKFEIRPYKVESWISLFKNKNYGHTHSHGHVDISGVYYYQTSGDDGDLFFECPVPNMSSSFMFFESMAQRWNHKPEVGKLLLFPGWLRHGISTNNTDNTRISISFNITFDRGVTTK